MPCPREKLGTPFRRGLLERPKTALAGSISKAKTTAQRAARPVRRDIAQRINPARDGFAHVYGTDNKPVTARHSEAPDRFSKPYVRGFLRGKTSGQPRSKLPTMRTASHERPTITTSCAACRTAELLESAGTTDPVSSVVELGSVGTVKPD